ncbi:MAG: bifunctional diguanylate cyclase/phosphodiesterase [Burkholderiales bacterium]|nr:bifunctional diguanylate cyclase/phosphodiesterase [Burkholderiales bacterium]
MLVAVADRLRDSLREGDTIGRMGGDEFVVLIEEYKDTAQILEVARKLLDEVSEPCIVRDKSCQLTASIGVSTCPQDGLDARELLKNADMAMYRAKNQGKNNIQFYSAEMNTHLTERLSLEAGLRRAVERDELMLLYQPRVAIADGRITGVEALVRWRHPTQGLINPAEFVPIAEDAGLFAAIGDWVLQTACHQLRAWQQQGLPPLKVSVNLSMRQFGQEDLIQRIREVLHGAGVEPARLEIEITESMVMRNTERAARLLAQLREAGIGIALDDFGTGYSSLGHLRRFPIGSVKVDRSLICALPGDPDAAGITRAVVAMAHSLGLGATAEAVETREQWDFLSGLGCDEMQGNYFSPAVPAETVTTMLQLRGDAGKGSNVQLFRPWRSSGGSGPES